MKHMVRVTLLLLLLVLVLVGCNDQTPPEPEAVYYTVSFDANGGSAVSPQTVKENGKASIPEEPTRENYIFDGWKNGVAKWNFSYDTVKADLTLTASWKSAADVFEYQTVEGSDTAILTALKSEYATLTVPATINGFRVVGLGEGVFAELSSDIVKKIVIPESVTAVGDEAFADTKGISVVFEGPLSDIGERAFINCDGLHTVTLSEGVTHISSEAFLGSGLRSLITPSTLEVIEESAFQDCTSLQTIVLYGSMAQTSAAFAIEDSAFRGCTALKTVFLYGTEADCEALLNHKTDNQNKPLSAADFCYYSETEPTQTGRYWYMHDGKPRVW